MMAWFLLGSNRRFCAIFRRQVQKICQETAGRLLIEDGVEVVITNEKSRPVSRIPERLQCPDIATLARYSVGVALPPQMKAIRLDAEKQPLPVSGPGAGKTWMVRRAHHSRTACALEGNHTAGSEDASTIHLDNEDRSAIRRKIRMMDHAAFARREVNIAAVSSGFVRGDQDQMLAIAHLGKQQALAFLDPGQ
jgi:hypothetical protein